MSGDTKDRGIKLLNFLDSKTLLAGLVVATWYACRLYGRFEDTERSTHDQATAVANLVEVSASLKTSTESLKASTEGLERRLSLLENRQTGKQATGTP